MSSPKKTTRLNTDTAVLEQRYGDEWLVLTYIGPGRPNMMFLPKTTLRGGSMRVRYL